MLLSNTPSTMLVYRSYHSQHVDHFYTTNDAEANSGGGYRYEGIGFYLLPPDPCPKKCAIGQKRCSGSSLVQCREDSLLCLDWVTSPCSSGGCYNDACAPTCNQQCSYVGQKQCSSGNKIQECNTDSNICRVWKTKTACANGCVGAKCKACGGNAPTSSERNCNKLFWMRWLRL